MLSYKETHTTYELKPCCLRMNLDELQIVPQTLASTVEGRKETALASSVEEIKQNHRVPK